MAAQKLYMTHSHHIMNCPVCSVHMFDISISYKCKTTIDTKTCKNGHDVVYETSGLTGLRIVGVLESTHTRAGDIDDI